MKRYAIGLSAMVAVIAVSLFYSARQSAPRPLEPTKEQPAIPDVPLTPRNIEATPASEAEVASAEPASTSTPVASESKPRYARFTILPGQPIPELTPFQAERDNLLNLAATQDFRQVPVIAASLSHAHATVRETARQALLQLGDASAAPALLAAAATSSPEEAALLTEAAEFLSLPKLMDVIGNPNPPASGLAPPPAP